ncbi:hypothetical protein, partial [Mycobacterium tuberculosis]
VRVARPGACRRFADPEVTFALATIGYPDMAVLQPMPTINLPTDQFTAFGQKWLLGSKFSKKDDRT